MQEVRFDSLENAKACAWRHHEERCVVLRFADGREVFIELESADGPWLVCEKWLPATFGDGATVFVSDAELHRPVTFTRWSVPSSSWTSIYELKAIIVGRDREKAVMERLPLKPAS